MVQIGKPKQKYASSQQQIRDSNTLLLFNLIRKAPASRVSLAESASLSPTTVSALVDDLIAAGWIAETGPDSSAARGRKPVMLTVNASRGYIATVELLSRGYICTVYDICLNKVAGIRIRNTPYDSGSIADTIRDLLRSKRIPIYQLLGIHAMFPGMVDAANNELRYSAVIPNEDMPEPSFIQALQKRYPEAHITLSTNGSIVAFAAFISEEREAALPLLSVNIDEGIIGGVVMCDNHNETRLCFPVEIGHVLIDTDGPTCKCGNPGCLESLCSTLQLYRMMNERTDMQLTYSDSFGADCNPEAMRAICDRLLAYDPAVTAVLAEYTYMLCCGLISTVNLIGIQSIRIGGDIAMLGNMFLNMIRTTLLERFEPLNSTNSVEVELIVTDYEHVRRAMVIMSMDELFRR